MSPASVILVRLPNDGKYGPVVPAADTVLVVDFAGPSFGGEFQKTGLFVVGRDEQFAPSSEGKKIGVVLAKPEFPTMFIVRDDRSVSEHLRSLYRARGWDTIGPVDDEDWRDYRYIVQSIRMRGGRAA